MADRKFILDLLIMLDEGKKPELCLQPAKGSDARRIEIDSYNRATFRGRFLDSPGGLTKFALHENILTGNGYKVTLLG